MPKVFEWRGYRFFFYSDEGTPLEPVHVHVRKDGAEAKFWLRPFVTVAYNRGFDAIVLRRLAKEVVDQRDTIEAAWDEHFAGDDRIS